MLDSHRLSISVWLAVLVAAILGCSSPRASSEPATGGAPGRGIYIQPQWAENRRITGHRVHVVEQRIACNRCHALSSTAIGSVSPSSCATCHEAQSHVQHAVEQAKQRLGSLVRADCASCHAFTSDDALEGLDGGTPDVGDGGVIAAFGPKDCARCHAQRQGQTPAIAVHATAECVSCHRPHEAQTPTSAPCANCHQTVHTSHASLGKSANGVCTTCHTRQHARAVDAVDSCVGCHAKSPPLVPASALFAGGHQQCVGCHEPHQFEKNQVASCRSCHGGVRVLAQSKVPAHAVCTSCHTPHDVRATPTTACAKCHQNVHPDHPARVSGSGCLTCHDPHPSAAQSLAIARPCSSCHQIAQNERAFHGGTDCQTCHAPHQFKLALAQHASCNGCHRKELELTAVRTGHAACQSCHEGLPHQPTAPGKAACDSCHAAERASARPGHQSCTGCHEPHGGGRARECRSCHAQEFASASKGHQTCTNCHQPHTGASKPSKCTTCHAAEAASAHGKIANDCASCHRPHGPKGAVSPPACSTCHSVATLPGLHQKTTKHQACSTCHGGHGEAPNLARLVCLTCHADRSSHFPEARCANCHLFQSGGALKAR